MQTIKLTRSNDATVFEFDKEEIAGYGPYEEQTGTVLDFDDGEPMHVVESVDIVHALMSCD